METLKNPKGWGFDCNDDWILHGIFRDVTLISRPPLNVADLSLSCKVDAENSVLKDAPRLSDYLNEESREYFDRVLKMLDALDIPYEIDDRLVRGLDYYTHTVFEVKSTREGSGAQSTIFAGGRYDHLVEYFGGPELSGMGFAIGLERLIALAEEDTPRKFIRGCAQ